jgi:hypothetical protein
MLATPPEPKKPVKKATKKAMGKIESLIAAALRHSGALRTWVLQKAQFTEPFQYR